jgi:dimethylhistidine N-methyltransferase
MSGACARHEDSEFLRDVLEGLAREEKSLPGKYLWDDAGSSIFDAICNSEDYYIAPVEMALLRDCADEVAKIVGAEACIVEFGSGAARKIRILIDALNQPKRYIAIDISGDFMNSAASRLRADYPALEVLNVCADYTSPLPDLPIDHGRPVLGFFPGNSVGNMEPRPVVELLTRIGKALASGWLLIGQDHNDDLQKLTAAYGGPLMATFHKNILVRMKRELAARIALVDFEHVIRILNAPARVEAHLVATRPTTIEVASRTTRFNPGDSIRTDASWKHTPSAFQELTAAAGLMPVKRWTNGSLALHLLQSPPPS